MFFLGRYAPCGGTLCALVLGVCVFMVEGNVKKLPLKALKETGDDPDEVTCDYFRQLLPNVEQKSERCSAEVIYSTKGIQKKGKSNSSVTERKSKNIKLRSIQPSTDTPPLGASRINPESATSM